MAQFGSISFVMAAYNEAAIAEAAVTTVWETLARSFPEFELILVDDGSTDETLSILKRCAGRYPHIRVLENGVNLNYGAAVLRGLWAARKEWVVYDAFDLEMHPEDFVRSLSGLREGLDMVVFQRAAYEAVPRRKAASLCNRLLLRLLFPVLMRGTPVLNHTQMFRRSCLPRLLPLARSPIFFAPEMVFRGKRAGLSWENVPIRFHCIDGVRGGAFGHLHDIIWGLNDMIRFRFHLWFCK